MQSHDHIGEHDLKVKILHIQGHLVEVIYEDLLRFIFLLSNVKENESGKVMMATSCELSSKDLSQGIEVIYGVSWKVNPPF